MSVSRFNLSFEYEFRIAAVANTGTGNYATSGPKASLKRTRNKTGWELRFYQRPPSPSVTA